MAERDVIRYVESRSIESAGKDNLLAAVGLSPEFPIKLRELNDVLATPRPDRLEGFSITLVPGANPQPLLETRYQQGRTIQFDVKRNRLEPLESIATIHIGDGREILTICTMTDIQAFVREAFENQSASLRYSIVKDEAEENPEKETITVDLTDLDSDKTETLPLVDIDLFVGDQSEPIMLIGRGIDSRYKYSPIEIREIHIEGKSAEITEKINAITNLLQKDFYANQK